MESFPGDFGLSQLVQFIDWVYLIVFVLLSAVIKKGFGDLLQKITKFTWQPVYTVMLIALLTGVPWALFTKATWIEVLVTYTIGTSLYEVILERIFGLFKK